MRFLRSRTFLFSLTLCALASAWFFWGANWLAERRWQSYIRDAKARGARWHISEFRPAPVPADQDAARLPVFADRKMDPLLEKVPYLIRAKKHPKGGPRLVDWTKTRKGLETWGVASDPAEPDDLRAIDQAIRPFQSIIEQLCESTAIAANWGDEVWIASDSAGFSPSERVDRCLRLLRFRASLDIALNRPADARRAIQAQMRLVRVAGQTPRLMSHIVTAAAHAMVQSGIWQGLDIGFWDDATLREFTRELLEVNLIENFLWGLETERAVSRELADRWIGDPTKILPALQFLKPKPAKIDEWLLGVRASRRSWWRDNELWIERCYDELTATLDKEAQIWRPIAWQYDPNKTSTADREGKLGFAYLATSSIRDFAGKAVRLHADAKMGAIACALELFRRANGAYPETLEVLVADYLSRIPVDPLLGRPFRYRLQPDGSYLLYALGFDGTDENGISTDKIDSWSEDPDWRWWAPRGHPENATNTGDQ